MLLPLPHCASLPFREPQLAVSVPQTLKATSPLAAAAAAPTGAVARFGAGSSEDGAAERFFFLSCDGPRSLKRQLVVFFEFLADSQKDEHCT